MDKKCKTCDTLKKFDKFHKNIKSKDSFCTSCKQCRNIKNKQYRERNLEKERNRKKVYYLENKEIYEKYRTDNADKLKVIRKRWYEKNAKKISKFNKSPEGRYRIYKRSAKKRGIEFVLTFEQFSDILYGECYWCGESSEGVDRVDNETGYFLENCVSCCEFCNIAKLNNCKDVFLKKICKIFQKHCVR